MIPNDSDDEEMYDFKISEKSNNNIDENENDNEEKDEAKLAKDDFMVNVLKQRLIVKRPAMPLKMELQTSQMNP